MLANLYCRLSHAISKYEWLIRVRSSYDTEVTVHTESRDDDGLSVCPAKVGGNMLTGEEEGNMLVVEVGGTISLRAFFLQ